jgi:Superinfection immunity protein
MENKLVALIPWTILLLMPAQVLAELHNYGGDSTDTAYKSGQVLGGILVIGVLAMIYFIPTTIAAKRKIAMGAGTMFWVNLLIGWTIIGWLVLIILAACAKTQAQDTYYQR